MKEKLIQAKEIAKKILFWFLICSFIYLMFTTKILSTINDTGIKGLCFNTSDSPCKYNIQIQY